MATSFAAVRTGRYAYILYYGHALEGVNALLPSPRNRITPRELAQALGGTPVTHLDILGCQSTSFAAELSTLVPKVKIGYLRAKRFDNLAIDPRTLEVISLTIDAQTIFHFGGPKP